jgi:two-component system, LytTR family, response regulator
MISCIVIDDEPMALNIIDGYISKTNFLELKGTFRDAIEALDFLQKQTIDLIFLDINMPDLNGVQFVKLLPPTHSQIIFCTAYSEYAVESYEHQALDYLLKPIEFDRFLKAALKAKSYFEPSIHADKKQPTDQEPIDKVNQADYILIKSGSETIKIKLKEITHIEGTGNYVTIHTPSRRIMSLQSMKDIMQHLQTDIFFRVHKSFIVSFDFVDTIENHQVKIGSTRIPVGGIYRAEFKQWMAAKMKNQ